MIPLLPLGLRRRIPTGIPLEQLSRVATSSAVGSPSIHYDEDLTPTVQQRVGDFEKVISDHRHLEFKDLPWLNLPYLLLVRHPRPVYFGSRKPPNGRL